MSSYVDLQKGVSRYIKENNGDQFKACTMMSKDAYNLFKQVDGAVSENEALSWALSGKAPVNLKERARQHMNLKVPRTSYMKKLLSYVDNDNIVESVEESFSQSIRLGSLTFYYPVKLTREEKARVRVLTRMSWFNR